MKWAEVMKEQRKIKQEKGGKWKDRDRGEERECVDIG